MKLILSCEILFSLMLYTNSSVWGERNVARRMVDASHALKLDIFLVVANSLRSLPNLVERNICRVFFFLRSSRISGQLRELTGKRSDRKAIVIFLK